MAHQKPDLLQGTLDLLILKALAHGPFHGWAISRRIQQMSKEVLPVKQGSLYPALYRLEDRGWIGGERPVARRAPHQASTSSSRPDERQLSPGNRDVAGCLPAAMNQVIAPRKSPDRRLARLVRRLRLFARRGPRRAVMHDEISHHSHARSPTAWAAASRPARHGLTALRDFGGIEATKEKGARCPRRPAGRGPGVDLKHAARVGLAGGTRLNTTASVATFALGIAAPPAPSSPRLRHLLRPLPYADPARLVALWERNIPKNRDRQRRVAFERRAAWRDRARGITAGRLVPTRSR